MHNPIEKRKKTYYKLSSHISELDHSQLQALFRKHRAKRGWGRSHVIQLGRTKVFVKRIPVTELEYENLFSTKNLYRLPTYYNYGVGSAGFGVFREVVTHIKTTNWVLSGAIEHFPLTYHYRIMPYTGEHPEMDMERHERYVKYWNSNKNIGRYMLDRAQAKYEVALFLEYVPHVLGAWLPKHMGQLDSVLGQMEKTITFLREHGIIHFDCDHGNILSDGEKIYVADFGLVLDKNFNLSKRERDFFRQNTHYDYGQFLCNLGFCFFETFRKSAESKKTKFRRKYGLADNDDYGHLVSVLLEHIEEIYADGILKLDGNYVEIVAKYRKIIQLMHDFYGSMFSNNRKNSTYGHRKLKRLLRETAFIT